MDGEKKINLIEGVPLNAAGAANIFLNTGNKTKVNSPNGTVIHLQTDKSSPADVGLHINTTFSLASSKKIKLLFILNFLLSVICIIISSSSAFYCWNEIISLRRQLDSMKEQLTIQNIKDASALEHAQQSALVSIYRPLIKSLEREPRGFTGTDDVSRTFYVENLGANVLLVDSSKKNPNSEKVPDPVKDVPNIKQKEPLVVHFSGAQKELNLGSTSLIGPWIRDKEVSSEGSEAIIELNSAYVTIKKGGLYLIYAQVVYLTHAPNSYFLWAKTPDKDPRLLSSCATGDDSSNRPLDKSQISCSIQTVARLQKGDIVNLAQREPNRTLWLRSGYSYFGFVKLSS